MTTQKDQVHFHKFDTGEVIALFPLIPWSTDHITSYMHLGQHGGASPELLTDLAPATPLEYADLKHELTQIGYDLEVNA